MENHVVINFPQKLLRFALKEYLEYNFKVYIRKDENNEMVVYGNPDDLQLCRDEAEYFKQADSQCLLRLNEYSEAALSVASVKLFLESFSRVLMTIDDGAVLSIYGSLEDTVRMQNYIGHYNRVIDKNIDFDFSEEKKKNLDNLCADLRISIDWRDLSVRSGVFIYMVLKDRAELAVLPITIHEDSCATREEETLAAQEILALDLRQFADTIPVIESSTTDAHHDEKRQKLRTIIIDGSNVGYEFSKHDQYGHNMFDPQGIKLAVDFFVNRGHEKVYALIPRYRPYLENHIMRNIEREGHLKYTPSRILNNVQQTPHDDRFILEAAVLTGGVVLSNDQYRDFMDQYKDVIVNRLIPYMFLGNSIVIPDDPHGPNRPTLDQLLIDTDCHQLSSEISLNPIPLVQKSVNKPPTVQSFISKDSWTACQWELFHEACEIFPSDIRQIETILQNNPEIEDLNVLMNYIIMAVSNDNNCKY